MLKALCQMLTFWKDLPNLGGGEVVWSALSPLQWCPAAKTSKILSILHSEYFKTCGSAHCGTSA